MAAPTPLYPANPCGTTLTRTTTTGVAMDSLAATLMYFSRFAGSGRFAEHRTSVSVVHGTAITYAAALAVSAALLWFFGRFDGHPPVLITAMCIVLALAATLGASAGRLLLR